MMSPMPIAIAPAALTELLRAAGRWASSWWRIVHLGSLLLVLALSPSSYSRPHRRALVRHLWLAAAPALLGFALLTTLLSLVVSRIVLVTAVGYGLSQYAVEMVVRVLVIELIPLTAALYAALRCTFPLAAQVAALRATPSGREFVRNGELLRGELLPRVAAGILCALLFAALSGVVTLVIAYLAVYGATTTGLAAYTRTVGQIFDTAVSLIFGLKILLFGITVALLPIASVLEGPPRAGASAELRGLVRMFGLIVLIESTALASNYA